MSTADDLKKRNDELRDQLATARADAARAQGEIAGLRATIVALKEAMEHLRTADENTRLTQRVAALEAEQSQYLRQAAIPNVHLLPAAPVDRYPAGGAR